jgi:hypothetical protein
MGLPELGRPRIGPRHRHSIIQAQSPRLRQLSNHNKQKQPKLKSKTHRLLAVGVVGQTWPTLVRFQEQSEFSLYFVCF